MDKRTDDEVMNLLAALGPDLPLEDLRLCLAWADEMFRTGRLRRASRLAADAILARTHRVSDEVAAAVLPLLGRTPKESP